MKHGSAPPTDFDKLEESQSVWMLARDLRDTAYARLLDRLDAARKMLRRMSRRVR